MASLFDTPSKHFRKLARARLAKEYNENQPRDAQGRWTAGGVAAVAALGIGGLLAARTGLRALGNFRQHARGRALERTQAAAEYRRARHHAGLLQMERAKPRPGAMPQIERDLVARNMRAARNRVRRAGKPGWFS